jgi:hypothetical protein
MQVTEYAVIISFTDISTKYKFDCFGANCAGDIYAILLLVVASFFDVNPASRYNN